MLLTHVSKGDLQVERAERDSGRATDKKTQKEGAWLFPVTLTILMWAVLSCNHLRKITVCPKKSNLGLRMPGMEDLAKNNCFCRE